jgi:hypothetical protein
MKLALMVLSAAVLVHGASHADEAPTPEAVAGKANVLGIVRTTDKYGIRDVDVVLQREDGTEVARTTTDADGGYQIPCVEHGTYHLELDPRNSGFHGQTVVAPIEEKGLVVVWTAATDKPAVASSTKGGGRCGAVAGSRAGSGSVAASNLAAIGAITGTIAVGGTLGGLAASGAFDSDSDGGTDGPLSPAQ